MVVVASEELVCDTDAAAAPLQFQLQEPHIVRKHGRIPAFQRSTFQTNPPQYPLSRAITAKHHCSNIRPTFTQAFQRTQRGGWLL